MLLITEKTATWMWNLATDLSDSDLTFSENRFIVNIDLGIISFTEEKSENLQSVGSGGFLVRYLRWTGPQAGFSA